MIYHANLFTRKMKLPLDFWEGKVALLSTTDPSGHQVVELREEIITPKCM